MKKILKKAAVLLLLVSSLFNSSCNTIPNTNQYDEYICYDYHLACLDAENEKFSSVIEYEGVEYHATFRKPVGISDKKFICASVRSYQTLDFPEIVIMQPSPHIDVLKEWSIKKIEIYSEDLKTTKLLHQEEEPSRTPNKILNVCSDSDIFGQFINLITNTYNSEKFTVPEGFSREKYNEDEFGNETLLLYIRIHFNESENIVWDSTINSYISENSSFRYITIDKGRTPSGIAHESSKYISTENFQILHNWISYTIDQLISG